MTVQRGVTTTDGLELAVYESGSPENPTIVCVHGYPDNHSVWDGFVAELQDRFHVVTYDVRGAGYSDAPDGRSGYRIAQLNADLAAVIDAAAPGEKVHLIAHDWGSIQSWDAVWDPEFADRLASYTSISGPSFDMAGTWLRSLAKHPRAGLRQLLHSYYVLAFQLPGLPERLVDAGLLDRILALDPSTGSHERVRRDQANGIDLYRANVMKLALPKPHHTGVPVQVLAPKDDSYVTVALQTQAPAPYVENLTTRVIPGGHWVVEQNPRLIAEYFLDWLRILEEQR
jgi:pimeloyl-ACP methyl ester carboxylesterase